MESCNQEGQAQVQEKGPGPGRRRRRNEEGYHYNRRRSAEAHAASAAAAAEKEKRALRAAYKLSSDRIISLCEHLGYGAPATIAAIGQGSYNIVHGLTWPGAQFTLRTPLPPGIGFCNPFVDGLHAAILQNYATTALVQTYTHIPVPTIVAFDCSEDNVLGTPYTLTTRMPGADLDAFYFSGHLARSQKINLARQLAAWKMQLESVAFVDPSAAVPVTFPSNLPTKANLSGTEATSFWEGTLKQWSIVAPAGQEPPGLDLHALFLREMNAFTSPKPPGEDMDFESIFYARMVYARWDQISDEVRRRGGGGPTVLHHPDLFPRNIMAEYDYDADQYNLSALLDLDDLHAKPRILARQPPAWLWLRTGVIGHGFNPETADPYDLDADELEAREAGDWDRQVQNAYHRVVFECLGGNTAAFRRWWSDTYGIGREVRRLFRFLERGFYGRGDGECDRFWKMEAEWWAQGAFRGYERSKECDHFFRRWWRRKTDTAALTGKPPGRHMGRMYRDG